MKTLLLMRTDKMIPRYAYQKSMKIQLPDKSEWQNLFSPKKKGSLVWYMEGSKTNEGTGAGCIDGAQKMGTVPFLGSTSQYSRQIYVINAHIIENTEKGYKDRNIYILSDSQAAIKALNNFHINSKLEWDCHQSLVKLTERNRVQLVRVPGNMGIDGNEIAD